MLKSKHGGGSNQFSYAIHCGGDGTVCKGVAENGGVLWFA